MKSRFPILGFLPIKIATEEDHIRAIHIISACIVLHNFCLQKEGDWPKYDEIVNSRNTERDELDAEEATTSQLKIKT